MKNKKEKSVFLFETKRKENKKDSLRDDYYIIINGIADLNSYYFGDKPHTAHFYSKKVIKVLLNQKFKTIGEYLAKFSFYCKIANWIEEVEIEVFCNKYFNDRFPRIAIILRVDFEEWSKAWSISEFAKELKDNIKNLREKNASYYQEDIDFITNGFGLAYTIDSNEKTIGKELEKITILLDNLLKDTNKNLLNKLNKDSLITYFHFPKTVQSACSQYLIYFTQFLADIGIEANTEIKEEANQTLFKVTPVNKDEALEKIQNALNVYLSVPGNKNFELQIEKNDNIASKQWEANIYYLKSQLALAGSIIQAKDTTIEALKLSNYQYEQILEKEKKQSDNKEDVIKNIVSVKEYDGKGFSINLPEILRKIKRVIK